MNSDIDSKMRALNYIKTQIITCTYPPGSVVQVDKIAEELNLSKTPIREALLELQYDNYVTVVPRKRTTVSTISLQDLKGIYDARAMVEIGIISSLTPEEIAKNKKNLYSLRDELLSMDITVQSREAYMSFLEKDLLFHQTLIGICENPYLVRFCNELIMKSQRFWYMALFNNDVDEVRREHLEILNLLLKGKSAAAGEALRKHISISKALSILSE